MHYIIVVWPRVMTTLSGSLSMNPPDTHRGRIIMAHHSAHARHTTSSGAYRNLICHNMKHSALNGHPSSDDLPPPPSQAILFIPNSSKSGVSYFHNSFTYACTSIHLPICAGIITIWNGCHCPVLKWHEDDEWAGCILNFGFQNPKSEVKVTGYGQSYTFYIMIFHQ